MEQVTFIQYYFHNPFSCFLFCYFIINLLGWIEKRDEWEGYLILSTVVAGAVLLGTLAGMAGEYAENKSEITILPINSVVSNVIMLTSLLFLVVYTLIKVFMNYKKKSDESKAIALVVDNLKSDIITLQTYIFKLESSEPCGNIKTLELQFELNDTKGMLDGIEFQKDKQNEIKRIKNKINEIRRNL